MNNAVILIIGKKRCGKTTMMKTLIKERKNILIIDPQYQFEKCNNWHVRHDIIKQEDFEQICQHVSTLKNITFCIDEIAFFVHPNTSLQHSFILLLRIAGQRGINIITTTHRIADLPQLFLANLDYLFCFKTQDLRSLETIRQYTNKEFIKDLHQLPKFKFKIWQF